MTDPSLKGSTPALRRAAAAEVVTRLRAVHADALARAARFGAEVDQFADALARAEARDDDGGLPAYLTSPVNGMREANRLLNGVDAVSHMDSGGGHALNARRARSAVLMMLTHSNPADPEMY